MTLTVDGQNALFNAQNTGLELALTHIQFGSGNRHADGSEVSLIDPKQTAPMSAQGQRISQTQIRVSALFSGNAVAEPYEINEIGIWAGDPGQSESVLFAYWSQASGNLAVMSVGVDFVWTHDLHVDAAVGDAINVIVDPDASTAIAVLAAHLGEPDPHPQYALKAHIHTTADVSGLQDALDSSQKVVSLFALPTSDIGPVIVAEASEVWIWVSTPFYTGYRSPLCGRPVDGHTVSPLANEIDAVGGLLSKTTYAQLWGYAQENSLVISQSDWEINIGAHWFVDVSDSQFRAPDLRNQFRRFTGTNVDNATTRALGSMQNDALQNITGDLISRTSAGSSVGGIAWGNGAFVFSGKSFSPTTLGCHTCGGGSSVADQVFFNASLVARTSSETRGTNVAFHPRIHI